MTSTTRAFAGTLPQALGPAGGADAATIDALAHEYGTSTAGPRARAARDQVVRLALPFAARLARRYRGRGQPLEDLEQVARLALVRAADKYDPARGPFCAYASVTIIGELRRYFRDTSWGVHVPRRLQELSLQTGRAVADLTAELARVPTVAELAGRLGVGEGEVREALLSAAAYLPASLNAPIRGAGSTELGELLGTVDSALDAVDDRATVAALLSRLPDRERRLLELRFYNNQSQAEIAAELGISQMHVSRLLSRSLSWLRAALLSDAPLDWDPSAGPLDAQQLSVTVGPVGRRVAVRAVGEIDRDTATRLRDRLLLGVRRAGDEVHVDVSQVSFIDAAGVSALLVGCEAARGRTLTLRLIGAQPQVRQVLIVAGLHTLLDPAAG